MNGSQTAEEAWQEIVDHARRSDATIETAHENSENAIWLEPGRGIIFQKDDGNERVVTRDEFNQIWRQFRSNGVISRQEVGDMTSDGVGAALFGTMDQLFDFELETPPPLKLHVKPDDSFG